MLSYGHFRRLGILRRYTAACFAPGIFLYLLIVSYPTMLLVVRSDQRLPIGGGRRVSCLFVPPRIVLHPRVDISPPLPPALF